MGIDKVLHFWIGALIAGAMPNAETGLALAVTAGVLKEVYDAKHKDKHTPEAADAFATALGGLTVYTLRVSW